MELNTGSIWQNGSLFLYQPIDTWPIKDINSFKGLEIELPDTIQGVNVLNCQVNKSYDISKVIDISKFNSYKKLLNVTARILKLKESRTLRVVGNNLTATNIQNTEYLWIKHVQSFLGNDWQERYRRLGPKFADNGLRVVGERISNWLKDNWNQSEYILLPYNHPFTKLLILHYHYEDHAGIKSTLAKLQAKFWVPKARKIIKYVKDKCVKCRFLDKKIISQKMGFFT